MIGGSKYGTFVLRTLTILAYRLDLSWEADLLSKDHLSERFRPGFDLCSIFKDTLFGSHVLLLTELKDYGSSAQWL